MLLFNNFLIKLKNLIIMIFFTIQLAQIYTKHFLIQISS